MEELPGVRAHTAPRAAAARSAVANGTKLHIEGVDGRTALARRYRDLVGMITRDLGGEEPAQTKQQLIRRAASLSVWCEQQEAKMAGGEDVEIGPYTTACNSVRRLLIDVGLERVAKDVTDIAAYLKATNR